MLSKKRWRFGLALLSLLICSQILSAMSPFDSRRDDVPIVDTDSTEHFTAKAIAGYLDETYGDKADQMWQEWSNDKGWATMIANAQAGDRVALIGPNGSVSWYYFDGKGQDALNGIYEVLGPSAGILVGTRYISGKALEEVRGNYALIGGVFSESNDTITLSSYPKGQQQGKNAYSGRVSGIDLYTMTEQEYYAWKTGPTLSGAASGAVIGWIVGGPPGALIGASIGAIAFAFVGSNIDATLPPRPVGSLIISFTVHLYGPSHDDGQYNIVFVGVPRNIGYAWSHGVRGPSAEWMPYFFSSLYILNIYNLVYLLLNAFFYILKKISLWYSRLSRKQAL